jgi:hypothetical protein
MTNKTLYAVIIGDMINSKKIPNRQEAQRELQNVLDKMNSKYNEAIASKFTITRGDEFQCLIKEDSIHLIPEIIDRISFQFTYPVRFGIALGTIESDLNPNQCIGMFGQAFTLAEMAIEAAKQKKKNDYGLNVVRYDLAYTPYHAPVNALNASSAFIASMWTTGQREILKVLLKNDIYDEDFSQIELAKLLNKDSGNINRRVKSSGIKIYLRNKKEIGKLLKLAAQELKGERK